MRALREKMRRFGALTASTHGEGFCFFPWRPDREQTPSPVPRRILPFAASGATCSALAIGEVANLMGYMLSIAANRHGILIHALCVMSNHVHADCTDPHGRWSAFKRDLISQSARPLNALHGRWETAWSKSTSQQVVTR